MPSHLAPLIGREAPLPAPLAARLPDWTAAAETLAVRLTDALSVETEAGAVTLGIKSAAQVRTRKDVVVVPVTDGFVVIGASDTTVVANHLLRAEPEPEAVAEDKEGEEPRALDTLLMGGIADEAAACVGVAFGVPMARTSKPRFGWPPAAPDAAPFLCASMPFVAAGRTMILRLLLDGPPDAFAAPEATRPTPAPALAEAAREASAPLSAVLDSWTVTAAEAASLRPGTVLPLPGASIEALEMVLALPGGPMRLATGELGKSRGRQAVRLTSEIGL